MRVVFIGPPGCGKGTQAALLRERLGLACISTGDALRAAIAAGTEAGRKAKPFLDVGKLVSDTIVNDIVAEWLGRPDAPSDFLLDGYPRTLAQAETLDSILHDRGKPLEAVIVFRIDDNVVVKRMLTRHRADDTEETVRTRLRFYHEMERELIGYYKKKRGLVHNIDADAAVEDVYVKVASLLPPKED